MTTPNHGPHVPVEPVPKSHRSELNRRPLGVRSISPNADACSGNDLASPTAHFGPERNANGAPETVREVSASICGAKRLDGVSCQLPAGHDGLHRVPWVDENGALLSPRAAHRHRAGGLR